MANGVVALALESNRSQASAKTTASSNPSVSRSSAMNRQASVISRRGRNGSLLLGDPISQSELGAGYSDEEYSIDSGSQWGRVRHASLAKKASLHAYEADDKFLSEGNGMNRKEKRVQMYLRWNLIWVVVFVLGIPFAPFYLLPLNCIAGQRFVIAMNVWGPVVMWYCSIMCISAMIKLWKTSKVEPGSWKQLYPTDDPRSDRVQHIVLMRGYKEPLELMCSTIDSVAEQTVAKDIYMVVGLEQGSPQEYDEEFYAKYSDEFAGFLVTRHPRGWAPGEQPGACSNANYAWRQIVQKLSNEGKLDREAMVVTSCDTDTIFPPDYMEYLGLSFLLHKNPHKVIWQAPLFYNLQLDERPFFVRCTGLARTAFMCGFLIGQSLNPMSIFSFSVDLLIDCDFIHPFHVMDDVVHVITCMKTVRSTVYVELLPLVVVSGPTSGANYLEELYEWARQVRRWCIGSMAVYHYYTAKQFKGTFTLWSGIRYHFLFTHYYGFVLCSLLLAGLLGNVALLFWRHFPEDHWGYCGPDNGYSDEVMTGWSVGTLAAVYAAFVVFFVMDKIGLRISGIKEKMPFWRNFLHWLMMYPSLLMYNIVVFWGCLENAVRGQRSVSHNASKKDALGKSDKNTKVSTVLEVDEFDEREELETGYTLMED